jgi:hypothetical protein
MPTSQGKILIAFGIFLMLVLIASGCGSSDEETVAKPVATGMPGVTKGQYIQKATRICKRLSYKLVRGYESFGKRHGLNISEPSESEREQLTLAVLLPNVEEKLAELKQLPAPKGDEGRIKAILDSMEHGIKVAKRHPRWLGSPPRLALEPFWDTMKMTARYGFWLCGQAGG